MNNSNIKMKYNDLTGDYEINHNGFSWISDGRRPYIIIRKKIGKSYISTIRPLMFAMKKDVKRYEDKIVCRYSGFVAFGRRLDFTLVTTAEIMDDNTVVFSLKAENETDYDIQSVYFPAPFNSKKKGKKLCRMDTEKIVFQKWHISIMQER